MQVWHTPVRHDPLTERRTLPPTRANSRTLDPTRRRSHCAQTRPRGLIRASAEPYLRLVSMPSFAPTGLMNFCPRPSGGSIPAKNSGCPLVPPPRRCRIAPDRRKLDAKFPEPLLGATSRQRYRVTICPRVRRRPHAMSRQW